MRIAPVQNARRIRSEMKHCYNSPDTQLESPIPIQLMLLSSYRNGGLSWYLSTSLSQTVGLSIQEEVMGAGVIYLLGAETLHQLPGYHSL